MKNHEIIDGKLLQTNKKYSHLKQKQKEKIYQWMYSAYREAYRRRGKYPDSREHDQILDEVMERIDAAEIWIPRSEVEKHYRGICSNLRKRLNREIDKKNADQITLELLDTEFTVCKVADYSEVDFNVPFVFTGRTDKEKSLVCPTNNVPGNVTKREDGWRGFRVAGTMDFSLVGVLYRISKVLANAEIGIFAVSTFDTDYIFTKEEEFDKAVIRLRDAHYIIS